MRHQEGMNTNCVDKKHICDIPYICDKLEELDIGRVFTRYPYHNKHIRPIQTSTNICTFMNKSVELVYDAYNLPESDSKNMLIVWNHGDINSILDRYGLIGNCAWTDDNFNGCLKLNAYGWEYDPDFFKRSNSWLGSCCISLCNCI